MRVSIRLTKEKNIRQQLSNNVHVHLKLVSTGKEYDQQKKPTSTLIDN